jgi:hypothetical protein
VPKGAWQFCAASRAAMGTRLLLVACLSGCTNELLIGNAQSDTGLDAASAELDAGLDAGLDAAVPFEAATPGVGASEVYANNQTLIAVSNALGSAQRWLPPPSALFSLQLAFQPSYSGANGAFFGYCPGGCPFAEFFVDAGVPIRPGNGSSSPDTIAGRYALYNLAQPAGTAFGVLYTEDGLLTFDLQVDWGSRPPAAPLEQIFLVFNPLVGRVSFLPQRP